MELQRITPIILSLDEAPNIGRTLQQLQWAQQIIVLDSGSTDATLSIARSFPNVCVHQRNFDTHAQQWNHALSLAPTDWVLTLDADYLLDHAFVDELRILTDAEHAVWYAGFRFFINGRAIRGALLPSRAVLFKRSAAEYFDDGHTQRLRHECSAGQLRQRIDHDDRKPLSRWLRSQIRYAELEAQKLADGVPRQIGFADRIRRLVWLAPILVFAHVYFVRGALLSGWRGWIYASQRALAELMLSLYLAQLRAPTPDPEKR